MSRIKHTVEKSLELVRGLPRVNLLNIHHNPGAGRRVGTIHQMLQATKLNILLIEISISGAAVNTVAINMVAVTKVAGKGRTSCDLGMKPATFHFICVRQ